MKDMMIWRIAIVLFVAVSLVSCSSDDPDGKWASMIWKAEVPVQITDGIYVVPAKGSVLTFSCRNYSPWIAEAVSGEEHFFPLRESNNYHSITTDWLKVEINKNKLNVTFESNDSAEERPLKLTVTAGDIFYTFYFIQFANRQN